MDPTAARSGSGRSTTPSKRSERIRARRTPREVPAKPALTAYKEIQQSRLAALAAAFRRCCGQVLCEIPALCDPIFMWIPSTILVPAQLSLQLAQSVTCECQRRRDYVPARRRKNAPRASTVACPRSPREGPARGATRPVRGWRRPARGWGLWAHGDKRGVIRTGAGVAIGSA